MTLKPSVALQWLDVREYHAVKWHKPQRNVVSRQSGLPSHNCNTYTFHWLFILSLRLFYYVEHQN
jgi:hypothetical protein